MKKKEDLLRYGAIACLLLVSVIGVVDCIAGNVLPALLWDDSVEWSSLGNMLLSMLPYLALFALAGGLLVKKNPVLLTIGAGLGVLATLLHSLWVVVALVGNLFGGSFSYYSFWDWLQSILFFWIPEMLSGVFLIAFFALMVLLLYWKDKLPRFLPMVLCWLPAMVVIGDLFGGEAQTLSVLFSWLSYHFGYGDWMLALWDVTISLAVLITLVLKFAGLLLLVRVLTEGEVCVTGKMIRIVGFAGIAVFVLAAGLSVLLSVVGVFVGYGWWWNMISLLPTLVMAFGAMLTPAAMLTVKEKEPVEETVAEETTPWKEAFEQKETTISVYEAKPVRPVVEAGDTHARLRQLKQMQEEGLITQEDYDIKKKQLLDL